MWVNSGSFEQIDATASTKQVMNKRNFKLSLTIKPVKKSNSINAVLDEWFNTICTIKARLSFFQLSLLDHLSNPII